MLEGAAWIHDWHNMDAELAHLTHDSSSDSPLVGLRSTSALRQLTFVSGDYQIDIEIEPSENVVTLTGRVSPVIGCVVQVVVGGVAHRGSIDHLGSFVITDVDPGTMLAFIETEAGAIRLGSFEV